MKSDSKLIFMVLGLLLLVSIICLLINKGGFMRAEDEMMSMSSTTSSGGMIDSLVRAGRYIFTGGGGGGDKDDNKDAPHANVKDKHKIKDSLHMEENINPCLKAFFEMKLMKLKKAHDGILDKTVVLFHYADWCPYCIEMKGPWNEVKFKLLKDNHYIFDEHNEEQCKTIGVNVVPTIFKIKGKKVCKYSGPKTLSALEEWVKL